MLQRRHHLLQAGAGIDRVSLRTRVLDGSHGLFVFSTLDTLTAATPDFFIQSFYPDPDTNFSEYRLKAYLQDHWNPVALRSTTDYDMKTTIFQEVFPNMR